jgi:hypothetical protein
MFNDITHNNGVKPSGCKLRVEEIADKHVEAESLSCECRSLRRHLNAPHFEAGSTGAVQKRASGTPNFEESTGGFNLLDFFNDAVAAQFDECLFFKVSTFVSASEVTFKILPRIHTADLRGGRLRIKEDNAAGSAHPSPESCRLELITERHTLQVWCTADAANG